MQERFTQEGAPKNPRSVGEAIAAAIPEHPAVASTSIAGPGFVNIVLREEYLAGRVNDMMQNGISSWAPPVQVPSRVSPRYGQCYTCSRATLATVLLGFIAAGKLNLV